LAKPRRKKVSRKLKPIEVASNEQQASGHFASVLLVDSFKKILLALESPFITSFDDEVCHGNDS